MKMDLGCVLIRCCIHYTAPAETAIAIEPEQKEEETEEKACKNNNNVRKQVEKKPAQKWPKPWASDSDSDDLIVYGGPVRSVIPIILA